MFFWPLFSSSNKGGERKKKQKKTNYFHSYTRLDPWNEFHKSEHSSSSTLAFPLAGRNPKAGLGACMRFNVTCAPLSLILSQPPCAGGWGNMGWWWGSIVAPNPPRCWGSVLKSSACWWWRWWWCWLCECQVSLSKKSCRANMAVRFSAMSSRSAALDLEERSDGGTQESVLDDRRERARPVGDVKYGNPPPSTTLFSVHNEIRTIFLLAFFSPPPHLTNPSLVSSPMPCALFIIIIIIYFEFET